MGSPMSGVHALIVCLFAAIALPGWIRTISPLAVQPQGDVPLGTALGRGDTVLVGERWF
jgi:hypothetical protein